MGSRFHVDVRVNLSITHPCMDLHLEDEMRFWKKAMPVVLAGVLLVSVWNPSLKADAADRPPKYSLPRGVYVELTKDFYEALQGGNPRGETIYSNDMSDEYLRQIAVSAKFTVETNLQIIKQQAEIIELLHSLLQRGK